MVVVPLRVLILEDDPTDAEMMAYELRRAQFDPDWRRVEREEDYLAHLSPALDVILADYYLPTFNALDALHLLQERGLDIPFIVVTGALGDETAVRCIQQGATDYLLKDRMARLGPAVAQAMGQKRIRDARRQVEEAQREAERIRVLLEMAGAAAHEINQPLTVIVARAELLLKGMPPGVPLRREAESIYEASEKISEIVRKMNGIQQYITKPYALGGKIIDFEAASKRRSIPA